MPVEIVIKRRSTSSSSRRKDCKNCKGCKETENNRDTRGKLDRTGEVRGGWLIPAGYTIRNWDCRERPLFVLGSVYDPNSLGKWIFDWTVYRHGAASPMADVAGDLWLLLLALGFRDRIFRENARSGRASWDEGMVHNAGTGLWKQLESIIADCEEAMRKVGKRKPDGEEFMDEEAGIAFVDCMFGRDHKLLATEEMMNGIRRWKMNGDWIYGRSMESMSKGGR